MDEYGETQLQDKWQTVLDEHRPESITAIKIAETLDENPEGRSKQVRIGGKAYQLLQKKAVDAGMAVSQYLEMLINGGEPPDDEPSPNDVEGTELTPEKEAICDRAEAFAKAKSAKRGFAIKKLSRCHQKAISSPKVRSDIESDSS